MTKVFLSIALIATALFADVSALESLLITISGYEAEDAEAQEVNLMGTSMISATRGYESDDAEFTAVITVSPAMQNLGFGMEGMEVDIEDDEMATKITAIDGFQVTMGHDKEENSGSISVLLKSKEGTQAIFAVTYEDLSQEEALELAKKYDWSAIQSEVMKL